MGGYEDSSTTSLLLDRVLPSPGIMRLRKIRLWIAVIIVITVVGSLFLLTSSQIHKQSRAYLVGAGQYSIKDTKVGAVLFLIGGWARRIVGIQLRYTIFDKPTSIVQGYQSYFL